MGDYYAEPVLLIKTAWGGKDLYCDFRPPRAGKPAYGIPGPPRELGTACREMVAEVRRRLDQIARREYDRAISHWECHYFGSARVYCLVGHGLAEAMTELLQSKWNLRAAQLTGGELQRAGAQGEAE